MVHKYLVYNQEIFARLQRIIVCSKENSLQLCYILQVAAVSSFSAFNDFLINNIVALRMQSFNTSHFPECIYLALWAVVWVSKYCQWTDHLSLSNSHFLLHAHSFLCIFFIFQLGAAFWNWRILPLFPPWQCTCTQLKFQNVNTLAPGWFRQFSQKNPAIFGCLTNALAPLPIALESCSTAQTDRPV